MKTQCVLFFLYDHKIDAKNATRGSSKLIQARIPDKVINEIL
jgi:hypothetical protein